MHILTGDVELHAVVDISTDDDKIELDVRTWMEVVVTGGVGLEDGEQRRVGTSTAD